MRIIKYLFPTLIAPFCFAGGLEISDQVAALTEKKGDFEVCDIQALSDGGTTSVCLLVDPGKLWLTKRSDVKSSWSAVYEDQNQPAKVIDVSNSDADALLFSWVKNRYSCAVISNMQSEEFEVSTREDLIAATIIELVSAPSECTD